MKTKRGAKIPDPWVQEIWLQRQRYSIKCQIIQLLINLGYDLFELEAMLIEIEELVYHALPSRHDQVRYLDFRVNEIDVSLRSFRQHHGLFSIAETIERTE